MQIAFHTMSVFEVEILHCIFMKLPGYCVCLAPTLYDIHSGCKTRTLEKVTPVLIGLISLDFAYQMTKLFIQFLYRSQFRVRKHFTLMSKSCVTSVNAFNKHQWVGWCVFDKIGHL